MPGEMGPVGLIEEFAGYVQTTALPTAADAQATWRVLDR